MHELIDQVREILAEIDGATARFARDSGLACPEGCGQCCENPQVETTVLEALPLAYWLLTQEDEARANAAWERLSEVRSAGEKRRCVFYGPTPGGEAWQGRCTVYLQRPGLCRLFGFAARLDRIGRPEPVICRLHRQTLPAAVIANAHEVAASAPTFYEFATRFAMLDQDLGTEQMPINEAIMRAMEKVGLWLSLQKAVATPL